jgi:hypothetical protein
VYGPFFISVPVPIFWAVLKRKRTTQELTRGYNVTVNEGTKREDKHLTSCSWNFKPESLPVRSSYHTVMSDRMCDVGHFYFKFRFLSSRLFSRENLLLRGLHYTLQETAVLVHGWTFLFF